MVFRESLGIYEDLLPPDHVDRVVTRGKIGTCLAATRRLEEALPILDETIESLNRQLGPRHPLVTQFRAVRDAVIAERDTRQGP